MVADIVNISNALIGLPLGAFIGSFMALLIVRLPSGELNLWGRSKCDHCDKTLSIRELLPIISYLAQHKKCLQCKMPIDVIHFYIEALSALIGMIIFAVFPIKEAIIYAALFWQLLLIAALDIKYLWIPNRLIICLGITGLICGHNIAHLPHIFDRIIGAIIAFMVLQLLSIFYQKHRGYAAIGSADPKLYAAMGLWIGWQSLSVLLLFAALIGLLWAAVIFLSEKNFDTNYKLPLGAFLSFSMPVTLLFLNIVSF